MLIVALIVLMVYFLTSQHQNRAYWDDNGSDDDSDDFVAFNLAEEAREVAEKVAEANRVAAEVAEDARKKMVYQRSGTTEADHKKRYPRWDPQCEKEDVWSQEPGYCHNGNGWPTNEMRSEWCYDKKYRKHHPGTCRFLRRGDPHFDELTVTTTKEGLFGGWTPIWSDFSS